MTTVICPVCYRNQSFMLINIHSKIDEDWIRTVEVNEEIWSFWPILENLKAIIQQEHRIRHRRLTDRVMTIIALVFFKSRAKNASGNLAGYHTWPAHYAHKHIQQVW